MALTVTEQLIQKLNYAYTSKLSSGGTNYTNSTYPSAIKDITAIYVRQAELGTKSFDDMYDFGEQLSLAKYLDRASSYEGIEQIPQNYNIWLVQRAKTYSDAKEDVQNIEQTYGRAI